MPSASYDSFDLMRVLDAKPQLDELAFCEFYVVEKEGVKLDVAISLAEPRVEISLERSGSGTHLLFLSFWCSEVRRVADRSGELLEFSQCIIGNLDLDTSRLPAGAMLPFFSTRLWVKPHVRVELV